MRRIRYIGNHKPENWNAAMAEHEEMIAALTARDDERLARAMHAHIANTWPRVSATVIGPDGAV
jgi:DNA-binding GntR family transcriptional regulator